MRKNPPLEYYVWQSMIQRCFRLKHPKYRLYGARGITVCDRWKKSFDIFLEDMGRRPKKGYSLDRINNDGNYEPGNCRWATPKEQNRNSRRNRVIEFAGNSMPVSEWAEKIGVHKDTLLS